jgi:putative ABC transport system substrate-binding protein
MGDGWETRRRRTPGHDWLIFSLGTHSTKRLAKTVTDIPMVFTIVGDPERAGIVSNWKSSGKNYTGVETPEYYSKVVRLMRHYIPFKSLGMIYLEGSPSHEAGISQIVALSKDLGFKFVRRGFPLRNPQKVPYPKEVTRNNITTALENVCPQVETFFVQTSNAFSRNFDLFQAAFLKHRLVSAGDPTNIEKGLVMGIGKDAYHFGEQCAQYAVQILEGAAPATLPMDVGGKLTIDVNLKAAEMIGFKPPLELLSAADNLYQNLATAKEAK